MSSTYTESAHRVCVPHFQAEKRSSQRFKGVIVTTEFEQSFYFSLIFPVPVFVSNQN